MKSIPGISAEWADPFTRFLILELMSAGVHRTVSTVVRQRKPLPEEIVVVLIKRLMQVYINRLVAAPPLARAALRNAVILASGFYGIRRSAELFSNAKRTMGLLVKDVTVIYGKRI